MKNFPCALCRQNEVRGWRSTSFRHNREAAEPQNAQSQKKSKTTLAKNSRMLKNSEIASVCHSREGGGSMNLLNFLDARVREHDFKAVMIKCDTVKLGIFCCSIQLSQGNRIPETLR